MVIRQQITILQQVCQAHVRQHQINVVNISAVSNDKLQKIAEQGQGSLKAANQAGALGNELAKNTSDNIKKSINKISQWLDNGYYLCFIPLLCCLYFFRRGIFLSLFIWLISSPAHAGFFLNADQEGLRAFHQQNYQAAAENFKDSDWQGSSYYRLGDYNKALQAFNKTQGAESLYNQGNALAKMGKIEEAIQKYEEVLKNNPEHEDAKFNLEYLKQQQNQQQPQSSDSENNDENQEQQDQDQQKSSASEQSEQKQNQDQEQNSQSEQEQEQSSQNQQQSEEEQQNQDQQNTNQMQRQEQAGQPQEQEKDQQQNSAQALQNNEGDTKYDEEVQAREMQYREIPEDPGGLLRAFIAREYAKNRYAKDK